jgi:V8-like Glu-specific endopeptidase
MFSRHRSFLTASRFAVAAVALACAALAGPAAAQRAPLAADTIAAPWRSAAQEAPARGGVLAQHVVRAEGATWLRLRFDAIELAPGSVLRITSLTDGARQHLNAETARQWRNTSAYFNGPAVRVELIAAEGSTGNRVVLAEARAGRAGVAPESQCGNADNRVASSADNRARLIDVGCTVNLTADGCFITAGHCLASASLVDVVEFNVPLSNANGSLVHPPPSDQYVPTTNRQFNNGGVGKDWGVFTVFANTETGLTPLEAQGPGLEFATTAPAKRSTVEITGYGVDSGSANQTQQVSTGPVSSVSGANTQLSYRADTEGGNSGSAVLSGGLVVAIHSHGGCTRRGGANSGTLTPGNTVFANAYQAVCGAPLRR